METGRREKLSFLLEFPKLIISTVGAASIVFAALQWRESNKVATQAVYQRIAMEWREHLKLLLEKPHLRPYFEEKQVLGQRDQHGDSILAFADLRLDTMDAMLTYAAFQGWSTNDVGGWRNTFANAFKNSPVLCSRLRSTKDNYGLIVPIAEGAC